MYAESTKLQPERSSTTEWHSIRRNLAAVYHNNLRCIAGARVPEANRREGSGGYPLCGRCDRLNKLDALRNS